MCPDLTTPCATGEIQNLITTSTCECEAMQAATGTLIDFQADPTANLFRSDIS